MKNKKWVRLILIVFFISSIFTAALNYIVDPFQQYRISDWYMVTGKKQRHVAPGLAKNFKYETVVIGSSMVENFDMKDIDNALSTKSLNLAMAGMSAHDMHFLLGTVIDNNPKIKNVILSLDIYELHGKFDRFRDESIPLYLYDDNRVNDINYLLNGQTFKYSVRMLREGVNQEIHLNNIWNWQGAIEYSKKSVVESYRSGRFNAAFKLSDYSYDFLKKSFIYNLLSYIEENPHVSFVIYYPPYSYVAYKDMLDKGWLPDAIKFKRYLADLNINNLKIYDFQCATSITTDLNNYKDITHFSPEINKYIISSLKNENHITTSDYYNDCLLSIEKSAALPFELDMLQ